MVIKKLDATLEERVSKAGSTYKVVVIKITPNLEKLAFLNSAELELLNLQTPVNNSVSDKR